jgi:hypothetical protein
MFIHLAIFSKIFNVTFYKKINLGHIFEHPSNFFSCTKKLFGAKAQQGIFKKKFFSLYISK